MPKDFNDIVFYASFGDAKVKTTISCNTYGGGSWILKCGQLSGLFIPTKVWGWRYEGDPLETDEIQYIIELISIAEGIPIQEFNANIPLPWWVRRVVFTREDWNRAIASLSGQDTYIEEVKAHLVKHSPGFDFH